METCFHFSRVEATSGIAGSYDNSMFNFFNCGKIYIKGTILIILRVQFRANLVPLHIKYRKLAAI